MKFFTYIALVAGYFFLTTVPAYALNNVTHTASGTYSDTGVFLEVNAPESDFDRTFYNGHDYVVSIDLKINENAEGTDLPDTIYYGFNVEKTDYTDSVIEFSINVDFENGTDLILNGTGGDISIINGFDDVISFNIDLSQIQGADLFFQNLSFAPKSMDFSFVHRGSFNSQGAREEESDVFNDTSLVNALVELNTNNSSSIILSYENVTSKTTRTVKFLPSEYVFDEFSIERQNSVNCNVVNLNMTKMDEDAQTQNIFHFMNAFAHQNMNADINNDKQLNPADVNLFLKNCVKDVGRPQPRPGP